MVRAGLGLALPPLSPASPSSPHPLPCLLRWGCPASGVIYCFASRRLVIEPKMWLVRACAGDVGAVIY
eukprot:6913219-Pyramimonas_sp.AAC.1